MRSKRSKEALIREISDLLEFSPLKLSTGSTEPKELFILISEILGLAIPSSHTKPEIAKQIVEYAGGVWSSECESVGGTVTSIGLERVRDAVVFFTNVNSKGKENNEF
jgi:hypothetical protein